MRNINLLNILQYQLILVIYLNKQNFFDRKMVIIYSSFHLKLCLGAQKSSLIKLFFWVPTTYLFVEK